MKTFTIKDRELIETNEEGIYKICNSCPLSQYDTQSSEVYCGCGFLIEEVWNTNSLLNISKNCKLKKIDLGRNWFIPEEIKIVHGEIDE